MQLIIMWVLTIATIGEFPSYHTFLSTHSHSIYFYFLFHFSHTTHRRETDVCVKLYGDCKNCTKIKYINLLFVLVFLLLLLLQLFCLFKFVLYLFSVSFLGNQQQQQQQQRTKLTFLFTFAGILSCWSSLLAIGLWQAVSRVETTKSFAAIKFCAIITVFVLLNTPLQFEFNVIIKT